MKITVNSPADFVENITLDASLVVGKEIWIRVDRGTVEDGSEAIQVSLTCVIKREGFDHILEFQQIIGYNIELGPDATDEGTKASNEIHSTMEMNCNALGLRLRKGRVEI